MAEHWMAGAFKNAHGQLHNDLGVPKDQKIPKAKLLKAIKGKFGKKAKKRAIPVVNAEK